LDERLSPTLNCYKQFETFYKCRGSGTQMSSVYETGRLKECTEPWEEFKWCFKAKFLGDEEAKQV
jgi:hypothetical protein